MDLNRATEWEAKIQTDRIDPHVESVNVVVICVNDY